jgi:hypothetical protein
MSRSRLIAAGAVVATCATAALVGALSSTGAGNRLAHTYRPSVPASALKGHVADVLLRHGREHSRGGDPDAGLDPAIEATANRAYPFSDIGIAETQRAAAAAGRVRSRHASQPTGWQEVGPVTLDVDKLGTQTFNRPTQWSGRVTALVTPPHSCPKAHGACTLFVGAAGGGVWVTKNALNARPKWQFTSGDIPSSSIGSLLVDPNDATDKTIYAGTGEESGSSDSEAGIGLYKSLDGGVHWSLVRGSFDVSNNRAIGAIAVDPTNPSHLFIGTDVARHGASSVNGGRFTPPDAPKLAVYESTDGGASFHEVLSRPGDTVDPSAPSANGNDFFKGGVTDIQFDPTHLGTMYATITDYGLFRSTDNGMTWSQIYSGTPDPLGFGIRYEMAPVTLPGGATRIYLGEGSNETGTCFGGFCDASKLWRTDDATGLTVTFTNLSSPDPSQPGFGSFDFCQGQCSYDMFVASPLGQPNTVWMGGSMQYGELPIYAGADRSDGRALVRSTDGGLTWTDMTGDARVAFEDQHPDLHAIAFDYANPGIAFVGSDGGVIRTDGKFADASAQCAARNLHGTDLTNCQAWLSQVPHRLITMNAGLATLQFQSVSVDPNDPLGNIMGGTQDNATQFYDGNKKGTWISTVTGDGGQSGIDAADPDLRYHTYYGPQGDVNFHGDEPTRWDWMMDPLIFSGEGASFYVPFLADPMVSKTAWVGANHVWRTQDGTGDPTFLDNHCYTNGGPKGDQLFSGNCGDWVSLGKPLDSEDFGASRGPGDDANNYVAAIARAPSDSSTLWAATRLGRVFVSTNADATGDLVPYQDPFGLGVTLYNEADVSWTRIDDGESPTPVTPQRFVSGISIDPNDPNHAWVSYSGYDAYATAAGTPTGHVFEVHFHPNTGTATWTNASYDLGDQPITGIQYDGASGDVYVSTDFGVDVLPAGHTSWVPASSGLPTVAVWGITLAGGAKPGQQTLYAATHGRGVWRLALPG